MQAEFNVHEFNESKFNDELLSKVLSESVTPADTRVVDLTRTINENIFNSDILTKQITAKVLSEELELAVWFTIKRRNSANWSDQ